MYVLQVEKRDSSFFQLMAQHETKEFVIANDIGEPTDERNEKISELDNYEIV